ncbi:MAG: hypothetical protein LC749_08800, partial [Actinobacteria bacterium]|nr:hypothetical protein [Actinomycetota bacterium]
IQKAPDAGGLVEEITDAIHQARRAIDRPNDDRLYLGKCGHENIHYGRVVTCNVELYGMPWLDMALCEGCGTQYRIAERQDWLRDRADKHPGTSVEVAGFLRLTGVACTPEQIRGLAHRRRLVPVGANDRGHPTYLISDVLTALRNRYARRAQPVPPFAESKRER